METMTHIVTGPWTQYGFHLVKWDLNLVRNWLIPPMTLVPLFHHQWA